jgi:hypothetical protein
MGAEARREHEDISTRAIVNRRKDRNDAEVTFQPINLGRLVVDLQLGLGKSSEAGSVSIEEFFEDPAFLFHNSLRRTAR